MTKDEQLQMENLGWEWFQDCPESGEYKLFGRDGTGYARENSNKWTADLAFVRQYLLSKAS